MGSVTGIGWTDHTFNPWRGCQKVSAGCANCYAETMSKRNPAVLGEWGPFGVRAMASESYWRLPLAWNRAAEASEERRRVFCASLADVFEDHEDLAFPRARLFDVIGSTPRLDWLLLTKRPENIVKLWPGTAAPNPPMIEMNGRRLMANVWLGVSVEDQKTADARIPLLLQTPAAVRFVSAEPLLGRVRLRLTPGRRVVQCPACKGDRWQGIGRCAKCGAVPPDGIGWVIVGGESGPGARSCDVAWIRSVLEECRAAGTACFVKQLGANPIGETWAVNRKFSPLTTSRSGADPSEWPEDLRVRQSPMSIRGGA